MLPKAGRDGASAERAHRGSEIHGRLAQIDRREMVLLDTAAAVLEVAAQRKVDAAKRNVGPRYVRLAAKLRFEALGPDPELSVQQPCAEHHVHLVGMQHV